MKVFLILAIAALAICGTVVADCGCQECIAGFCPVCPNISPFSGCCGDLVPVGCPFDTCCATRYMMPARFSSLPSFTAYPVNGSAPLPVQFYAMVPGVTGTYIWTFGDGSGSSDRDPLHVYTTPGTYTVSLSYTTSASETESRWTFRSSVTKRNFIVVSGSGPASAVESVTLNTLAGSPFVLPAGTQTQALYSGQAGVIQWTKPTVSAGIAGYMNTIDAKKVAIPAYPKFSRGTFPV